MLRTPFTIPTLSRTLIDIYIRFGLIALLAVSCFEIFKPFMSLILWSMILAITMYPLQTRLKGKIFDGDGRTATLIVFVVICVILVPSCLIGVALIDSVERAMDIAKSGQIEIPLPPDSVASIPMVGQRIHDFWQLAATDFGSLAEKLAPQIKVVAVALLGTARGVGVGLLVFVAALMVAGIFMAYGELGTRSAVQIASRITTPERGPRLTALCTATVRAVAQGVVGIAFIQMLLIGIAFVFKGIPGAGLLGLVILLLGIMQLPATLITIPVIIYVFATEPVSLANIVFAVYVFIAGLADNVLKPLLLGRGVDVPMPVVLIGALGGMVTGGVIGLFIGPVALAVGYQLFWQWVEDVPPESAEPVAHSEGGPSAG
jgi:predicted PurR-regulated permease PerM